jgi:hypothetical protein
MDFGQGLEHKLGVYRVRLKQTTSDPSSDHHSAVLQLTGVINSLTGMAEPVLIMERIFTGVEAYYGFHETRLDQTQ